MAHPEQNKNIVETSIEAGKNLAPRFHEYNGIPFLVHPLDYVAKQLDDLAIEPIRIKQTVHHTTAASFIDYYNRFSNEKSAIFINDENCYFSAILDYHKPGSADARAMPGWNQHRSHFTLEPTEDFKAWKENNKKPMSQDDFGRFIEDHLPNIQTPPAADMLEIALSIQAKTEVKFSKATRLQDGQTQFSYSEVIDGQAGNKGQLKIPDTFSIGIALYRGCPAYKIDARLRYRINNGALQMWYELIRLHDVIDDNMKDVTEQIIQGIAKNKQIYTALAS